jgi:hypothetical protein
MTQQENKIDDQKVAPVTFSSLVQEALSATNIVEESVPSALPVEPWLVPQPEGVSTVLLPDIETPTAESATNQRSSHLLNISRVQKAMKNRRVSGPMAALLSRLNFVAK